MSDLSEREKEEVVQEVISRLNEAKRQEIEKLEEEEKINAKRDNKQFNILFYSAVILAIIMYFFY